MRAPPTISWRAHRARAGGDRARLGRHLDRRLPAWPVEPAEIAAALARLDAARIAGRRMDSWLETDLVAARLASGARGADAAAGQPHSTATQGEARLKALFGRRLARRLGAFTRAELAAAGAIVDYLELTQKGKLPRLVPPARGRARATAWRSTGDRGAIWNSRRPCPASAGQPARR